MLYYRTKAAWIPALLLPDHFFFYKGVPVETLWWEVCFTKEIGLKYTCGQQQKHNYHCEPGKRDSN